MKRRDEPVEVEPPKGVPAKIRRGGVVYVVRDLVNFWKTRSGWWAPEKEEERVYFLVVTNRGTLEVYRSGAEWRLTRVFD